MLKSLLITYFFPPKIGGIENYLENVCKQLPNDRILVLTDKLNNDFDFDKKYQYKILREELFPWKFIRPSWLPLIWRVKKIIIDEKIDIIQFGHYSNLVTLGLFLKKPLFVYTHGVDTLIPQKSYFQKKLMIFNLKRAKYIIANSEFMKKEIIKLGIDNRKIIVCRPCLDIDLYDKNYKIDEIKKKYNLYGKKVILTIGRLIERKGQDSVVKALPKIIEKVPAAHYLIIGEGPYRPELELLIKKMKLEDKVTLFGSIEDRPEIKSPFFHLSEVFIMPARKTSEHDIESFGIVYLEAQINRVPVIASFLGGASEAVSDKVTGFLVNPNNIDEIADTTIKLLTEPELAKEMGEKGREWVIKNFNCQDQIKKIVNLLQ
jgi:phosphatidylinositol alpha-1,6-mannosyltransferase